MALNQMLKDFYIQTITLNLTKIFSFDCEKELLSDQFGINILDDIFIRQIPTMLNILSFNVENDYLEIFYPLLKEKLDETTHVIEKIVSERHEISHSAKLNGIKYKITGNCLLISISTNQAIELLDELKKTMNDYISEDNIESFRIFLSECISKIKGIDKCVDKIKQVLEILGIPKQVIFKFGEMTYKNNASCSLLHLNKYDTTCNCNCNHKSVLKNDNDNTNTFLSKKRNPSKLNENQNENNDMNIVQSENTKNRVIEDYFKAVDPVTNINNIKTSHNKTPDKQPISKKSKRQMSKAEDELKDKNLTPSVFDFLSFEKVKQSKNSNNKLNTLIHPSLTNSFNKSTYSNSFANFEVSSFHNSEISSISKTKLNPGSFRGINSKLSSSTIMQKFSIKNTKAKKKNKTFEKVKEKCQLKCGALIKKQEDIKPNQNSNSKLDYFKKIVQRTFYSNESNNTSLCNSKENSNNIPWNFTSNNNNMLSNTINTETKDNSGKKDRSENRDPKKQIDEEEDEILVYKTPEKRLSAKFDYPSNNDIPTRNLLALFTQTIN